MPLLSPPARLRAGAPPSSALGPASGPVRLVRGTLPVRPEDDAGVGPALLAAVAQRRTGGWLRIYRPSPTVGFSRRDTLSPGFSRAVDETLARGFVPVVRAPGGRAAAYHEGAVCVDLVVADCDPRAGTTARFVEFAAVLVEALGELGVEAGVGELVDEYCPGRYSVHARGRKLAGTAQRLTRGGWFFGAVVLADGSDRVRDVIGPVYAALGLPCDLGTVGAVSDIDPGIEVSTVEEAITSALARRLMLADGGPPVQLAARAGRSAVRPRDRMAGR